MKNFGQEVLLEVFDESKKNLVFSSDGLRVDFDIRIIASYRRATFSVWNVNTDTVAAITSGKRYATLSTRLLQDPDSNEWTALASKFFVSNALDVITVPNSATTLYCYDNIKDTYLDNVVDLNVKEPTLGSVFKSIVTKSGMLADGKKIDPISFPPNFLDKKFIRPIETKKDTVRDPPSTRS